MRTHGFGMMAELVRDIVYQTDDYNRYQNAESSGAKRPGKTNREIVSSFVSCRAESVLQYGLSVKFITRRIAY